MQRVESKVRSNKMLFFSSKNHPISWRTAVKRVGVDGFIRSIATATFDTTKETCGKGANKVQFVCIMNGKELKEVYFCSSGDKVAYVYDSPNNRFQYSEGLFDDIDDELVFRNETHEKCSIPSRIVEKKWEAVDDDFIFKTDTLVFKAHKDDTDIYLFFYW